MSAARGRDPVAHPAQEDGCERLLTGVWAVGSHRPRFSGQPTPLLGSRGQREVGQVARPG
ncbi:hypothetical protein FB563_7883 [Streptomyces puniciscabiei]|uniref:Uncharacterized protein n=1 Tax=Streptomyces puniciscabiei TaxID=164348 RepID=A0A542SZ24_9ACTN|nr:hypothetical protein FB563_7883 [Streptomyces puniciscabiei]